MKVIWSAMRSPEDTDIPALLRRLTLTVLVLMVLVIGLCVAVWLLLQANDDRISDNSRVVTQIQNERTRNVIADCLNRNAEHAAIVTFITDNVRRNVPKAKQNDPRITAYLELAQSRFPQADCRKEAAEKVRGETP